MTENDRPQNPGERPAGATASPYRPLADAPERIKFVRVDATHYPGEYAAESYDPLLAQTVYAG